MMVEKQSTDLRIIREKVEILFGDRGDPDKAALRRGEISALTEYIASLRLGAAAIGKTLEGIASEVASTKIDVIALQSDVATAQSDLVTLQGGIDDIGDQLSTISADLSLATDGLANLKTNVASVAIPTVGTTHVTAAPTQDDFNDMMDDLAAIRTALANLRGAITL